MVEYLIIAFRVLGDELAFFKHIDTHIHVYRLTSINSRTPYSYKHLRKTRPIDLENDEVTTGVSLLMGISPTTKRIR